MQSDYLKLQKKENISSQLLTNEFERYSQCVIVECRFNEYKFWNFPCCFSYNVYRCVTKMPLATAGIDSHPVDGKKTSILFKTVSHCCYKELLRTHWNLWHFSKTLELYNKYCEKNCSKTEFKTTDAAFKDKAKSLVWEASCNMVVASWQWNCVMSLLAILITTIAGWVEFIIGVAGKRCWTWMTLSEYVYTWTECWFRSSA